MTGHIARLTTVDVYERDGGELSAAEALASRVHRLREAKTSHTVTGMQVTWDEDREWGTRRTSIEYRDVNQGVLDLEGLT